MVKIRGEIRKFGNDAWQARVLGKTSRRDDLRVRHKKATHSIETNVAIEKWDSEKNKYVNALKIRPGKHRDDVDELFYCSKMRFALTIFLNQRFSDSKLFLKFIKMFYTNCFAF